MLLKINLATSVDVERVFSQGRILLSHLRSRLSVQSIRALMCVGAWSLRGYVHDNDIKSAITSKDSEIPLDGKEDVLPEDWDTIESIVDTSS